MCRVMAFGLRLGHSSTYLWGPGRVSGASFSVFETPGWCSDFGSCGKAFFVMFQLWVLWLGMFCRNGRQFLELPNMEASSTGVLCHTDMRFPRECGGVTFKMIKSCCKTARNLQVAGPQKHVKERSKAPSKHFLLGSRHMYFDGQAKR